MVGPENKECDCASALNGFSQFGWVVHFDGCASDLSFFGRHSYITGCGSIAAACEYHRLIDILRYFTESVHSEG